MDARYALPAARRVPLAPAIAALGLAAALAGCVPPVPSHASVTASLLYVANGVDGTITRLDDRTGRVAGPLLPAGPLPEQVVPGPDGSLLVRSYSPSQNGTLTHVAPGDRRSATWAARPVALEAGAGEVWLAGAAAGGGREAVVAYRAPDPRSGRLSCRVALVDAVTGALREPHSVGICPANGQIVGLALDGGPGGAVAYLGIWQPAEVFAGVPGPGRTWLVAVQATTGAILAVQPLASPPASLVLAPAPGRSGSRLYALETLRPPEEAPSGTYRGQLRGFNPITLDVESEHSLDPVATWSLAVAPDGNSAYALTYLGLTQVDLWTGIQRTVAYLPNTAISLAVTAEHLYVPNPWGGEVWVLDRRQGGAVRTVPVGRGPLSIALGPAT
jgi:hypothetical protein